jgi:hypothetical protein
MTRSLTLAARVIALLIAFALWSSTAFAQQLQSPQKLPQRQANYAWDKTLLRASFSYRDAVDGPITNKLSSGLPTVIVLRAYLFRDGDATPIALAARTCRVVYDLWDEVYRIRLTEQGRDVDTAAPTLDGVIRRCAEARDMAVVDKSLLKSGERYFLAGIAEVNPISPQMLEQMRKWMARPAGSTGIGPSDALFGSFAGLFLRQIGTSDKTIQFRTQSITN